MSKNGYQQEPTQESYISELQEILEDANLRDLDDNVGIEANKFAIPCRSGLRAYLVLTDGRGRLVVRKCCVDGELVNCP